MGIKETILAMGKKAFEKPEPEPELSDDETRDKVLRGLRRQQRIQREKIEKIKLREQIAAFQKREVREELFGFKKGSRIMDSEIIRKKVMIKKILGKRGSALNKKNSQRNRNILNDDMPGQIKKKTALLSKGDFI